MTSLPDYLMNHPARGAYAVPPAQYNAPLPGVCRGFVVAVTGNIDATYLDGSRAIIPAVQAGQHYGGQIKIIHSAGTTASGIVRFT